MQHSTLCPKKVSPLNILQQPPQTCTRFKWNFTHTIFVIDVKFHKNPLFRLRDVQFFQTAGVKINGSYYRDTLLKQHSCCQPFVQSLVTSSPSSKTVPSPPCPWDGSAIVSWDTRLHQPNGLATVQGWTFWLFWLTSTAMETHDLWVMLFKNSYFSKIKADLYETTQ